MEDLVIRVPESAHKGFLDRETVVAAIDKDLKPWCDLLEDLVSYGSNLIPRCFVSSGRELKDIVVLAIMLRQVVAMLDGVHVLLSQGACYVSQLPARALFESSIYIDWILAGDAEKKCRYYYVHDLRRKRLWVRRVKLGSAESEGFTPLVEKVGMKLNEDVIRRSAEQLEEIERVLSEVALAPVSADFDKFVQKRKHEPQWYLPLGPRNLRDIAKAVDRLPEYVVFYSSSSEVTHASGTKAHIAVGKGDVTFQPIRSVEGFDIVLRWTVTNALGSYRSVLKEYRPTELANFRQKYLEKWQKDFLNVPNIKVKVEPIKI